MTEATETPGQADLDREMVSANSLMGIVVVLTVLGALMMVGIAALTGAFAG